MHGWVPIMPNKAIRKHQKTFFSQKDPTRCFKNQHFWKWNTKTMTKKNLIWTWTFFLNLGSPDRQCDMYCDFVAKNWIPRCEPKKMANMRCEPTPHFILLCRDPQIVLRNIWTAPKFTANVPNLMKSVKLRGGWLVGSQVWVNGPQFGFFF